MSRTRMCWLFAAVHPTFGAVTACGTAESLTSGFASQGLALIQGDPHYVSASERLMGEKMATAWSILRT